MSKKDKTSRHIFLWPKVEKGEEDTHPRESTIVPCERKPDGGAPTRTENQDRSRKLDIPIELSIKVKQKTEKRPNKTGNRMNIRTELTDNGVISEKTWQPNEYQNRSNNEGNFRI